MFMPLKQYLIIMSAAAGISLVAFGLVVFFISPVLSPMVGLVVFYLSLGFFILSATAVLGLLFQVKVLKADEVMYRLVVRSLRQGALFAIFGIVIMFLQSKRLLTWGTGVPLLLLLGLLEYGLSVGERRSL